jgi:hypothetical protein
MLIRLSNVSMKLIRAFILATAFMAVSASAQDMKLKFVEGQQNQLTIREILKITLYQPQVEEEFIEPSVRTFDYSFTETIEKVNADGSARIAVVLDSFKTKTLIGEGRGAEEYFKFSSTDDYDLKTNFRDIKAYPRAQFLGQTLRFTVSPDGLVQNFENLSAFQMAATGKGFEYDMVRAILALADTLRMSQLFEQGFGGIAALGQRAYADPSTMTEVPVTRRIQSQRKGDSIFVTAAYINPPDKIEYLEGIAIPIVLTNFRSGGAGKAVVKKGMMTWGNYKDTMNVTLNIDPETIPYKVLRDITVEREPLKVMSGVKVRIEETKQHRGVPKAPELKVPEDAKVIELPGATIEESSDPGKR